MSTSWKAALVGIALLTPGAAQAQDFYDGKTITYIVATSPGGGYDTYARLIGKYLEKHLNAKVLIKNVPGAGHIVGANTLWAAEPDGLTIGTFNTGLIYAQVLGREGIQFDLREMAWIGKAASDPRALVLSTESEFKSFEDLSAAATPVKFATAGVGSASYTETQLIASAFDLDIEVVPGFNGNEGEMAMMRGEIAGQVGSLSSLKPFVDNGDGVFALAVGSEGEGIPEAASLAETDKGKSIVGLVQAMSILGRLTAAPPGTPDERLAELRAAYAGALADPELLAEAEKLGIPIDPAGGEEVAELIDAALNQSPGTVEIIAAAVDVEIPMITLKTPLVAVSPDGKEIEFKSGDTDVKAAVSGSRTTITIDGAEAERDQLKAGMTCEISYDPQHEENEPQSLVCGS
jgi:tripartite-type tricarboxylate transporter receptor subunit TctC